MPNGQNGILKQGEIGLRILIVAAILALFAKVFVYDQDRYAPKGMVINIKDDLQDEIQKTRAENYNRLCDRMAYMEKQITKFETTLNSLDEKIDKLIFQGREHKP